MLSLASHLKLTRLNECDLIRFNTKTSVRTFFYRKKLNVPVGHDTHHQISKYGAHQQREFSDVHLPGRITDQVPLKPREESQQTH